MLTLSKIANELKVSSINEIVGGTFTPPACGCRHKVGSKKGKSSKSSCTKTHSKCKVTVKTHSHK